MKITSFLGNHDSLHKRDWFWTAYALMRCGLTLNFFRVTSTYPMMAK